MTRKLTLLTVVLVFAFSCGKDGLNLDDATTNHHPGLKPHTRDQINQQALRLLNEHQKFEWRMVDAQTV